MPEPRDPDADRRFLARAFELARGGFGRTSPNPAVGAVVVRDGAVVGEGYHARCGEAHAEVVALDQAGDRARGGTLYVTLEPCCHQGRTGPCTERVIRAGVARVVHAVDDPSPRVGGGGIRMLTEAGVATGPPLMPEEGRALIAPFHSVHAAGRPYTVLKWAASLDGKIATRTGQSQWISGPESRRWVHRLRNLVDLVAVGRGTAAADDPRLTARDLPVGVQARQPARLVVDTAARLAQDSQLVMGAGGLRTLVGHVVGRGEGREQALAAAGCELLATPPARDGRVDLEALWGQLARRQLQSVLVEGGGELGGALVAAGLVDAVVAFLAPKLIGGRDAPGPLGGDGPAELSEALELRVVSCRPSGGDLLLLAARETPWQALAELAGSPV